MNIVDISVILIVLLFGVIGFKKGVIKTLVQLIGTIAVLILAYTFKDMLANFLMGFMPFFQFSGILAGVSAFNILLYELVSFVVIFILLYCILNIIINISGLIETILKFTVILAIPSKILGAIVGLLEGIVVAFILSFVLLHVRPTQSYVMNSDVAIVILERTPFLGTVMNKTTLAMEEINEAIDTIKTEDDKKAVNASIIRILIHYQIVKLEDVEELIENKKLTNLEGVTFGQ